MRYVYVLRLFKGDLEIPISLLGETIKFYIDSCGSIRTCIRAVSSIFKIVTTTPQLNLLSADVPAVFYIGTSPYGVYGRPVLNGIVQSSSTDVLSAHSFRIYILFYIFSIFKAIRVRYWNQISFLNRHLLKRKTNNNI